jgi:uncharacterized protein YecT (DUF1311 family)
MKAMQPPGPPMTLGNMRQLGVQRLVARGTRTAAAIFSCALLCWTATSTGMEFTKVASRNGIAIKATGPIEIGDADKLLSLVPEATIDDKGLRRIILESPGGDVAEAMRLATVIRNNNFVTLVGRGDCASACAMVLYPAGRYFMLLDGGRLGFHPCYGSRSLTELPECTEAIASFATANGFPYGSLKTFASLVGPASMYWVTNVLAYCYGMEHFIGDPAPVTVSTLCPHVGIALISGKFLAPDRPLAPSFDCRKASSPTEVLLCRDNELMHLDTLMGGLYQMIRRREGGQELLAQQRAWINERDKKCVVAPATVASYKSTRDAARCISEMTMTRMDELLKINGTPRNNLAPLFEMMKRR